MIYINVKKMAITIIVICLITALKINGLANQNHTDIVIDKKSVKEVADRVAKWQIQNFDQVKHHHLSWPNAAFYIGLNNWAEVTENQQYIDWLYQIGKRYHWHPNFDMYVADDIAVCQMYLRMYRLKKQTEMLQATQCRIEWIINHPSKGSLLLDYGNHETLERWSWCDALFMAPPVYVQLAAITGEKKYLRFMHKEFLTTYNFLYDKEEHLFFRDYHYLNAKEANGQKVFWGRGNGWVIGGLVSILKELPIKCKYRSFYENLFVEMIQKLATIQGKDGYWHTSLLDPDSFPAPETSASGFICYGLAYGINIGLLDREKFMPILNKAWIALTLAVSSEGKLGWVQPVGMNPKNVTAEMTEIYGVGAFLSAASEVIKLAEK